MYKLIKNHFGEICSIQRISDNTFMPLSPDNTDYQAYLEWIAQGNTPQPADTGASE